MTETRTNVTVKVLKDESLHIICVTDVQNAALILDNMVKDIVAESDSFDVKNFIPRLSTFLTVNHGPNKCRFLIDWITLLESVPDIDMLTYLPELLDGMFTMLSDVHTEIRMSVTRALEDFLVQVRTRYMETLPVSLAVCQVFMTRMLLQRCRAFLVLFSGSPHVSAEPVKILEKPKECHTSRCLVWVVQRPIRSINLRLPESMEKFPCIVQVHTLPSMRTQNLTTATNNVLTQTIGPLDAFVLQMYTFM